MISHVPHVHVQITGHGQLLSVPQTCLESPPLALAEFQMLALYPFHMPHNSSSLPPPPFLSLLFCLCVYRVRDVASISISLPFFFFVSSQCSISLPCTDHFCLVRSHASHLVTREYKHSPFPLYPSLFLELPAALDV